MMFSTMKLARSNLANESSLVEARFRLIRLETQLRYQCTLKLFDILSSNTFRNVCVVEREGVRNVLRSKREIGEMYKDQ